MRSRVRIKKIYKKSRRGGVEGELKKFTKSQGGEGERGK
jgi:hypothetical protein